MGFYITAKYTLKTTIDFIQYFQSAIFSWAGFFYNLLQLNVCTYFLN